MRIRIIAVPPGEAPAWVREKWIGLELPLTQRSSSPIAGRTYGVLSGPRSCFGMLAMLVRGKYWRLGGYRVNALKAISVLEKASPEAAHWWRTNTPHMMKRSRMFLFHEHVCEVVE